jgi:predicted methyltransferase
MVGWFQTLLYKNTKKRVNHTIQDILGKLGELADKNKPMVVEYDQKQSLVLEAISILESKGHRHKRTYRALQSTSAAYSILVFNQDISIIDPKQAAGFALVTESIRQFRQVNFREGAECRVFDPFAGVGKTARAVINAGATYIGSEINEQRYIKLCAANP